MENRPFKDWPSQDLIRLKKKLALKAKLIERLKQKGIKPRHLKPETKTENELPILFAEEWRMQELREQVCEPKEAGRGRK